MIFLLLAVLSSATISVIMRLSSHRVKANLSMLCANYLVCSVLGAAYAGFSLMPVGAEGFSGTAALGVLNGVLFLASFMLLQFNTRKNGIVLSSIFMKLGLLVPILMSVLFFHEMPTWLQLLGFCISVGAILLINLQKDGLKGFSWELLLLLLLGGSADAMSKVYEVLGEPALSNQFLFYTFVVALVLCSGLALLKKERPTFAELGFGFLIGIPNFFSSKFLLGALTSLPAVVVYPTFCVATMLLVTLAGVCLFKERLPRRQWIALGAIILALVLLNI